MSKTVEIPKQPEKKGVNIVASSVIDVDVVVVDIDGTETTIKAKFFAPNIERKKELSTENRISVQLPKLLLWVEALDTPKLIEGTPVINEDGVVEVETLTGKAALDHVYNSDLYSKMFYDAYIAGYRELVEKNFLRSLAKSMVATATTATTSENSEASPTPQS